jgi:hypothetical protein
MQPERSECSAPRAAALRSCGTLHALTRRYPSQEKSYAGLVDVNVPAFHRGLLLGSYGAG